MFLSPLLHARRVMRALHACIALVALLTTSCTPPPPVAARATVESQSKPIFAVDAQRVVEALAKKPNITWQDSAIRYKPLVDARKALRPASYSLKAPTINWTYTDGTINSTPAYRKSNPWSDGPLPQTGDWLYVATSTQVRKLNPADKSVAVSSGTLQTMTRTAVGLNGANLYVYVLSANGYLTILNADTLATVWSQRISQNGFTGRAPWIDYSNGGGFPTGYDENLYALATDGSLYRCRINTNLGTGALTVTVNAFPSSNGTDKNTVQPSWSTNQQIPYGAAVTIGNNASPVVWNSVAYFGTTTGVLCKVNVKAAPVLTRWDLSPYTSAQGNGRAITAPVAIDVDGSFTEIDKAFVPVGDRVVWINTTSPSNVPVASPPLVLDKRPPSATYYANTLANFPYSTTTKDYTAIDNISISSASNPTPTRWGSGGAVAGVFSTGISCGSVKTSPLTGNVWTGHYISPLGQVKALKPDGTVLGTYNSTVTNVNEICMDAAGNCYAAHGNSDKVVKFDKNGNIVQTFTLPSSYKALWPEVDSAGNLWCTTNNNRLIRFNAAGTVTLNVTVNNTFCIATDALNNAYITRRAAAGQVVKYNAAGALVGTFNVGNQPTYVALEPVTGNIWTCNNGSNNVTKLSPLGITLGTYNVGANQPWAMAFDKDGLPWFCCFTGNKVQKCDLNGTVLASYTMTDLPFEITFDGNGDAWVACQDGLMKLYDLGNLGDLFANPAFGVLGDGVNSLSYLKFRVTTNNYTNMPPKSAAVRMTAATTPTTGVESLSLWEASNLNPDTSTLWKGYAGTPDINYGNRPALGSLLSTLTNQTLLKDVQYEWSFNTGLPVDKVNSSDGAGGIYAYAHRTSSTNKVLKQVGHWYSLATGSNGPPVTKPTLRMTLINGGTMGTANGIRTQPALDTDNQKVWVAGCNAVFQLDYSSAANFMNPAQTRYNFTQSGRVNNGPLVGAAGTNFFWAPSNVLFTYSGRLVVPDTNTSTSKLLLNNFAPLTGSDQLGFSLDVNAGGTAMAEGLMLYDYDQGSVYITTTNNSVIRADVL